jgi:diadenosine tetraphosphate (Ap4A) HIT family hydrolase
MDFEKLIITRGKYWDAKMHHNQNCLGRCLLWYKGKEKDLLELNEEEQKEFWALARKLKKALNKLFKPDKYNYLSASNQTTHLHFHIFPRYKEKRIFDGKTLKDKDYGKLPLSENLVEEEFLWKIRDEIKRGLN